MVRFTTSVLCVRQLNYWFYARLHGTSDVVYSVANAEEEIKLFTASKNVRLQIVEGGRHFLSFSHPKEVADALLGFVKM